MTQFKDTQQLEKQIEVIRRKILIHGKLHRKDSNSVTTQMWNVIFEDLTNIFEKKHPEFCFPFFTINVYKINSVIILYTKKELCTKLKSFHLKGDNLEQIVKELNTTLINYNLMFVKEEKKFTRDLNPTYKIEFVEVKDK